MTGRSIVLTNPDLSRKYCQDTLQIILTQKTSFVIYLREKIELDICTHKVARELLSTILHQL